MTGEPALEPPSYYFTKPAVIPDDASASTCQPPPDGAQRFSRRVRGISAENRAGSADNASEMLKTNTAEPSSAQSTYRMVTKRIRYRRSTLPRSLSPWCRSTRRVYRRVVVYVDENGKELSAVDMHKRTKAGISQSAAAETEKNTESAAGDKATKKAPPLSTPGSETQPKRLSMTADAVAGSASVARVCNQLILSNRTVVRILEMLYQSGIWVLQVLKSWCKCSGVGVPSLTSKLVVEERQTEVHLVAIKLIHVQLCMHERAGLRCARSVTP